MNRSLCWALSAMTVAGCATPTRPAPAPQGGQPQSVSALVASVQEASNRSDRESQAVVRAELASQAERDAASCIAQKPDAAACLYSRALADGMEARAHPTQAGDYLKGMLDALGRAEAADATYDEAGPARVRALVLIRAPGWPLGPGDADAGVAAARRAVGVRPDYPPNLLALAEACTKADDAKCSRDNYTRAREVASAMPEGEDRTAWVQQADQGLRQRAP